MTRDFEPFLLVPDSSFVLTPEERGQMFVAFDPDVVEKILRWVRPEHRDTLRRTFFVSPEHQLKIDGGFFAGVDHPELADLLTQLTRPDSEE